VPAHKSPESLFAAVERGDLVAVQHALAAGADVEARDARTGWTPLMAAAASPHADAELVRLLLDHGADVNACGWMIETAPEAAVAEQMQQRGNLRAWWNGTTPLILAAGAGDLARVRTLIEAGADISATDSYGSDALSAAAVIVGDEERALRLVALLLEPGGPASRWSGCCSTRGRRSTGWAGPH
jgi:hypothetical protein